MCACINNSRSSAAPAIEEERHDVGGGFIRTQPRTEAALLDAHHDYSEELREAAAGLCYMAARCGDLPELQEARARDRGPGG